MLAVEKGQLKVAKLMIEKDPSLASLQLGSGVTVVHWALESGLVDTFFKVCFSGLIIKFWGSMQGLLLLGGGREKSDVWNLICMHVPVFQWLSAIDISFLLLFWLSWHSSTSKVFVNMYLY